MISGDLIAERVVSITLVAVPNYVRGRDNLESSSLRAHSSLVTFSAYFVLPRVLSHLT